MTDTGDPELDAVDRAARVAANGLRAHVDEQVEPELMLAALPPAAPAFNRGRLLAAAAVAALFIGTVAMIGDGPRGDDRSSLELDEDGNPLPPPEPGVLTPLGPRDGRDSIHLPVTVEPSEDLTDGQVVTVSSPGFAPGEQVGIVQCASTADEGSGEEGAGIDGCDVGSVQYADADAEGVAIGTFTVHRALTTPATGTVDCASEAQRCAIGMGALADYDRSGSLALTFRGGGEPIDIPTVTVSATDGLSDGDVVHVEGEGFAPGPVGLELCAIDPSGCWSVGETYELSAEELAAVGWGESDEPMPGSMQLVGLLADDRGRISGDLQVWRFLPSMEPGTYIDCAVSTCSVRISNLDGFAPTPPVLHFLPGGAGPQAPAVAVTPTRDLEPGDAVVVRGRGFEPGASYTISLCAASAADPSNIQSCYSSDSGEDRIDPDGSFAREFEVPDPAEQFGHAEVIDATTTTCAAGPDCGGSAPAPQPGPSGASGPPCDGVRTICMIRVEVYREEPPAGPPQFPAVPIPVTYRS